MKNICPTTSARKDVQLLRSTSAALAAVVAGGAVVTWGDRQGGDSSKVLSTWDAGKELVVTPQKLT